MKFLWKILSNQNVQLAVILLVTVAALAVFVLTYDLDFSGLIG